MDVWGVVDIFSLPLLRSSKNSSQVECPCPHFLAVILADLSQLLCQMDLNLLHPEDVGFLLRGFCSFLSHPSSLLSILQFCLQIQDLLFGRGQLYLNIMKLFALLLNLVLGILQASLSTLPPPLLSGQLCNKLLVLLLNYAQCLIGLDTKVGLNPSLIMSILPPLSGHKYLVDGLHRNDRRVRY